MHCPPNLGTLLIRTLTIERTLLRFLTTLKFRRTGKLRRAGDKMNKKEITANAPKSLLEYVNKKSAEIDADDKRREAAELLAAQERERREKENLQHGLELANKIWKWVQNIRRSDLGKKLIRLSHIPTAYHLIIFWDGYETSTTNWFSLAFSDEGLIRPLGTRMFTSTKFSSASELAKKIPTDVLHRACVAIDDGSVWQRIEKGFLKKEGL